MTNYFMPTKTPEDWKQLLAKPELHWKTGYSAKSLAYCWEEAQGFPASVKEVFAKSEHSIFHDLEYLVGFPEYDVPLPGGDRASQNDIFVLARNNEQLITIAVEGKVAEHFGPTVEEKLINITEAGQERLEYLLDLLHITETNINGIRYQLLHRTASALIEAERYHAKSALMLVHTFSQDNEHFDDYRAFLKLFEKAGKIGSVTHVSQLNDIQLYTAWVTGEECYLHR